MLAAPQSFRCTIEHGIDDIGRIELVEARLQGAGPDAGDVEQALDAAVEAGRLGADRSGQVVQARLGRDRRGRGEDAGRAEDAGDRRAQLMRDGLDQDVAQGIAALAQLPFLQRAGQAETLQRFFALGEDRAGLGDYLVDRIGISTAQRHREDCLRPARATEIAEQPMRLRTERQHLDLRPPGVT